MEKLIAIHAMRGDDGNDYTVHEYQEYLDASTLDGEDRVPGLKRLVLPDGGRVNHIDDDTYKIVRSGVIVRRG
jgi:hypothetical protein